MKTPHGMDRRAFLGETGKTVALALAARSAFAAEPSREVLVLGAGLAGLATIATARSWASR